MTVKSVDETALYDEYFELGYNWKYGDSLPFPILGNNFTNSFPTTVAALSKRLERNAKCVRGFNDGMVKAAKDAVEQIISYYSNQSDVVNQYEEIAFELGKLIRNSKGIHPSTLGPQIGQALVKLRTLNGKRYDKEVLESPEELKKTEDETNVVETIEIQPFSQPDHSIPVRSIKIKNNPFGNMPLLSQPFITIVHKYILEIITEDTRCFDHDYFFKCCKRTNIYSAGIYSGVVYRFGFDSNKLESIRALMTDVINEKCRLSKGALMLYFPEFYQ